MSTIIAATLAASLLTPGADVPRFAHLRLSTGVRLHYAEQGPARGEPIILLHGYTDSWFSFSGVMPVLARDARVYALDLRGHGNSDRPATGYHMRDLAADVLAFMDAKEIVRATVIGHSMGGFVAQQVALAAPRRVSRLVIAGSATSPRAIAGMDDFEKAVSSLPDPVPEAFAREFQLSTIHAPVSAAFIDRAVSESLKLPARVWRELMTGMLATERTVALGRSGIPTLVLRGAEDTFISPAEHDSLVAMVAARRNKTYPNTGHALHWERPEEFARDVQAFLADTRSPR